MDQSNARTYQEYAPRQADMEAAVTLAREADLALPEFLAFNAGQSLPRMRRWELPFVLFQARLSNGMAMLDCTINPAGFGERLSRLFPDTLYRHFNPVRDGSFALPLEAPDHAFDRVVCVNTLEHLVREQRAALIAELARKLKAGGLLVLTSDYYFDSAWSNPALLSAGVMRADRAEIFNGWNKVTALEWLETCRAHGLELLPGPDAAEPSEDDSSLYLQAPPYSHACMGAVFRKGQHGTDGGRRVVLSLLTWNTRDASLESLAAHVREARMLGRLGHMPFICVCDNGSTDGTADALHTADEQLDVPHLFIFNSQNQGSSVARNQIIDCMLARDADYLLFVDGDIELVPFSSVAMLRCMENHGSRVGCLGADWRHHTTRRAETTPCLFSIDPAALFQFRAFALTQYGMFRRAVFDAGVRFDQSPPFDGPGWGVEDNDLAMQLCARGFLNQYFSGVTYLHRSEHSSHQILREHGFDVDAAYRRRREHFAKKWQRGAEALTR